MSMQSVFPYKWNIADGYPAKGIEPNGCKVFGTFICGGGSSMGYKLAGFDHLGGVELDPKIAEIYKDNQHPKYLFNEDIRDFNRRQDLPAELYNLDILDGSPPCSTFSIAGSREDAWGKEKKFAEGQKKQTLDDLVFVYCDTILKLKPKVFILENVKGLAIGNGKAYLRTIVQKLSADYNTQVFILNAATMGVPQTRERCFIIGLRKEFALPPLKLHFDCKPILFGEIREQDIEERKKLEVHSINKEIWEKRILQDRCIADTKKRLGLRYNGFTNMYIHDTYVSGTIAASAQYYIYNESIFRKLTERELKLLSSFPLDYNVAENKLQFVVGMSVPPVMMAQVSHQIYIQWLSNIKNASK